MEALEYLRAKSRMCNDMDGCDGCEMMEYADKTRVEGCADLEEASPEIAVAVVEKWGQEHRRKRRPPLRINEMANAIHENAVEHGWWEGERSFPEIIALCHSELSEALECYRDSDTLICIVDGKPEGIAVEMVDCMIRIMDYLAFEEIDIEYVLNLKHKYNETRPYKHGGKRV